MGVIKERGGRWGLGGVFGKGALLEGLLWGGSNELLGLLVDRTLVIRLLGW